MLGYTPRFDAAVKTLERQLGGTHFVRVSTGFTRKIATVRHTQGEHIALCVRVVSGKERLTKTPIPTDLKIRAHRAP